MTPLVLLALLQEDFAPTWEKIATTIRAGYYARVARHDEMEARLAKYAPLAKAAGSRAEFESRVNAMIAEFHDSHFELFSDADQGYYTMTSLVEGDKAPALPNVGAWFAPSPDGYTVQMVLEGGEAARAGLRVGDLVERVDARPFTPVASLAASVGSDVTLHFRRAGKDSQASVKVGRAPAMRMFLDATLASRRTIERKGKRFGYIHLWTQGNDGFQKALTDAVAAARETDGFILDLRGGFGGYPYGYDAPFAKGAYEKPLVVIVDHGSRSAKEVLSYNLQKSGRATIVGERTAGAVLGTSPVRINAWSYLEVPMIDWRIGDVRLEGQGVVPDVSVRTGEDPIAKAVEILSVERIKV